MSFSSQALLNEAFKMTTDYLSKKTLGRDEELQMLSCSYANLFLLAASKASMNELGSAHELIAKCFERLGDTVWSEKHKVTAAGYFKL
ncbi:MAG: hypothetical protein H7061_08795 [Bdellovibrionaceae bacterium]|nr:hypothetical protein [Bdellovibrio sp.]